MSIIVFDQTIPIVDYTLFVTTGETVALAWELPHQPIYDDELMQIYDENGTLPLLHRNDDITLANVQNTHKVQDSYYFGNQQSKIQQNYNKYYHRNASPSDAYATSYNKMRYHLNNVYHNEDNEENGNKNNIRKKIPNLSASYKPWRRTDWTTSKTQ